MNASPPFEFKREQTVGCQHSSSCVPLCVSAFDYEAEIMKPLYSPLLILPSSITFTCSCYCAKFPAKLLVILSCAKRFAVAEVRSESVICIFDRAVISINYSVCCSWGERGRVVPRSDC